ncbi:MAG: hypothetical protein WEB87_05835 [Bacteriovoracaceae bacterium]
MSAAKKFKDHYPKDKLAAKDVTDEDAKRQNLKEQSQKDKALIDQYVKKIEDLLQKDPNAQKRAAQIVQALINSKNPNKKNAK